VIFPLSNPTSKCEATPEQLLGWTDGRALIGTGSPFPPVDVNGRQIKVSQTNNSYIFPGLALGIISTRAKHVSDSMIKAASVALADLSPTLTDKQAELLPPLGDGRSVSMVIARAVGLQAMKDGHAQVAEEDFEAQLDENVWEPVYVPYEYTEDGTHCA
jgi:malate dehydrogenase (oxaloacetate-decarboxylating)